MTLPAPTGCRGRFRGPDLLLSFVLRALLWCALCAAAASASAAAPSRLLVLDNRPAVFEVWPSLSVLSDPSQGATLAEVQARRAEFVAPEVPSGNFGTRPAAVWLHLPLHNQSGAADWVLQFDYAMLQHIDVHLLRAGREPQHIQLGSAQPHSQRSLPTLTHAVALDLPPGERAELYIRVQTATAMLLPISLQRPAAFVQQATSAQMLQGLYIGLSLALLAYAVFNAISLRDAMFAQYAVMLSGMVVFFAVYFGVAQQYLWPAHLPLLPTLAPMAMLVTLAAASLFIANALDLEPRRSRLRLALQAVSALAALGFVAALLGLIDYRTLQLLSSSLGPVPLLLALPVAVLRMRGGDVTARWLVLGWGAYLVGAVCITGLLRGVLAVDFWTQHAFQFSTLVEMLAWVRVLGLRIEGIRRNAQRADNERGALMSLAHTDPLTGLPNRRGLQTALQAALAQSRPDRPLAVYLVDLDGFKPINDRLGHDAGDQLLVQVGQRLRQQVRQSDVVGRLGGDEFVVLLAGMQGEADAMALGWKLVDAFNDPFVVAGKPCRVGLTVGFALAPHDGQDAADLLKRADAAMYAGKQQGRNCVRRGGASPGMTGLDSQVAATPY